MVRVDRAYDLIAIGTGSAMNIVGPYMHHHPGHHVAVIDKDEAGGICLTRGCIPTKLLTYPAEVANLVRRAKQFGVDARLRRVDFAYIMRRMRSHIDPEIRSIERGLSRTPNLDYYREAASFVAPYTLRVGSRTIRGKKILLCTGSKVKMPPIEGIEDVPYHTSDTILRLRRQPRTIAIIGGGYIACEFGHFFAGVGTRVTILGRNERILPDEEPEVSNLVRRQLGERMTILTNHAVERAQKGPGRQVTLTARDRRTRRTRRIPADVVLVAAGRASNSKLLQPEKGGIAVDAEGWLVVNEYLETSQRNVWAFGDATGRHMVKHKANYESVLVARRLLLGEREPARYDVVPHAVFTDPEVAGVGMSESRALEEIGPANLLVGFQRYEDTAKGESMGAKDHFVKGLVDRRNGQVLGCSIVGPHASILIQEVINVMHARVDVRVIQEAMHIHPALSEVVERAFGSLRPALHRHGREPSATGRSAGKAPSEASDGDTLKPSRLAGVRGGV